MALSDEGHQRSLKDFLTLYNTITEFCFNKCISNFNERNASVSETSCLDVCTDNYVQYNQRFMFNFVDHQERRKRDADAAAIEAAAKSAEPMQDQAQKALDNLPDNSLDKVNNTAVLSETSHEISGDSDQKNTPVP